MDDLAPPRHSLHCPDCGTNNEVQPDVVAQALRQCGAAIFSPEVENDPEPAKALIDRTGDVLRIICPHRQGVNELPEFQSITRSSAITAASRWKCRSRCNEHSSLRDCELVPVLVIVKYHLPKRATLHGSMGDDDTRIGTAINVFD